jgi:hypothetical protein
MLYVSQKQKQKAVEGFSDGQYIPRIIWSYWNDPEIPPKVEKILREREALLSTWEHRVLNEKTVYNYIPRDSFPDGYDKLSHQHKADWIRLYILKDHGGCWMDSSIIVNSPNELERLYRESLQKKSEFTGFYLSTHTMKSVKESYIENWFIMAPPNSQVIRLWHEEYTDAVQIGFINYKKKVYSAIDVSNIYPKDDNYTYLTQHVALQYVLQVRLTSKPNILIFDAADTMFKPHIDCKWEEECVIRFIKNTPKEKQPSYIKLRSNERNHL